MGQILTHHGVTPQIDPSCFLAEGSVVIGDVVIGKDSSLWYHSILRGDVCYIRIGSRSNIQDLCIGHVDSGGSPLIVEDDVTVGHRVVLHGCHIQSRSLIGIGSIIMNDAVVGEESLVGAGSLVTEKMVIPPRTLVFGSPAKVKRDLTPDEIASLKRSADHYAELARTYR